jgi:sulfate permease, SulP family
VVPEFGGIPTGLPQVSLPQVRPDLIVALLPAAVTVAMLAAIESLLSAVVADSMGGDRHNSNVELLAQGVANLAVPFVGGLPATGAIARTATNIKSGARTPVSGMGPRANPDRHFINRCVPRAFHSAGHARRDSFRGGLQHE